MRAAHFSARLPSNVVVKILYLTGGAGRCTAAACLRDNALAGELIRKRSRRHTSPSTRPHAPTNRTSATVKYFWRHQRIPRTVRPGIPQLAPVARSHLGFKTNVRTSLPAFYLDKSEDARRDDRVDVER